MPFKSNSILGFRVFCNILSSFVDQALKHIKLNTKYCLQADELIMRVMIRIFQISYLKSFVSMYRLKSPKEIEKLHLSRRQVKRQQVMVELTLLAAL